MKPHSSSESHSYHLKRPSLWGIFEGGSFAGIIAGLMMLTAWMLRSWSLGSNATHPLHLIAATFFGEEAARGGLNALLIGLSLHLAVSAFFGVVYASLRAWAHFGRARQPIGDRAAAAGALYSIAIWLVMTFGIVPMANPLLADYTRTAQGSWLGYHMIYGVCLLATPRLRRRYAIRHLDPGENLPREERVA